MNSGFTLVEICMVILCLSVLALFTLPPPLPDMDSFHTFPDAYLRAQSEAIRKADYAVCYSEDGSVPDITFNEKGNVNKAMTLHFEKHRTSVIIELGGGRLVFR